MILIVRLLIEDLERYIYGKDTKKEAEKQAVERLFRCPEGQRTERTRRTGTDGEPLHSCGLPNGVGRGVTGHNLKHEDAAVAFSALRMAPICA